MNKRDRLLEILRLAFSNHPGSLTLLVFYDDGRTASHFLPPQKVGHDSPPAQEDYSDVKGLAGEILRVASKEPTPAKVLANRVKRTLNTHFYKALRSLLQEPARLVKVANGYRLASVLTGWVADFIGVV